MIADTIRKLVDAGDFKTLVAAGVISVNVQIKFEMYEQYAKLKGDRKVGSYDWQAIEKIAIDQRVSLDTVYRAVKAMEQNGVS